MERTGAPAAARRRALETLFGSRARVEVLALLVLNPARAHYLREIAALTKLPVNAVREQLVRLESIRLVASRIDGNRRYYQIARDYPIYPDLKAIFLKLAAVGEVLAKFLGRHAGGIRAAFVYGSYASGEEREESDIDLFVVGSLSSKKLFLVLDELEESLGREVNPTLLTEGEFKEKVRARDHFVSQVLAGPKIFVIGTGDDIAALGR